MKKLFIIVCLLWLVMMSCNAQHTDFPKLSGQYLDQKLPENKPLVFASSTVSNGSNASSPAISPYVNEKSVIIKKPLPKMEFVRIDSGSFNMGCDNANGNKRGEGKYENMVDNDKPLHRVSIKSFQMMTTEITCEQWNYLMNGQRAEEPLLAKGNVTFKDVKEFIKKLNKIDPGKNYRLPSEAEWEFACWAGSSNDGKSVISAKQLDRIAWTNRTSDKKIHQVALKEPNAWGLYDMIGNVHEWCEDEYHTSYDGAPSDGSAWITSASPEKGVIRGGDCWMELFRCSPYSRDWMFRNKNPHFTIGFRLVRDY